jgi:hypothetical protein
MFFLHFSVGKGRPSVNPATPTPGMRTSITFTPVGLSVWYTWSQVRPGPTSTVPCSTLTIVSLKHDIEICMPRVDEKPGFVVCPPRLTAKGVLHAPRILSCRNGRSGGAGTSEEVTLQSCSRPLPIPAPPSKWSYECSKEQRTKCRIYTEAQLDHLSAWEDHS